MNRGGSEAEASVDGEPIRLSIPGTYRANCARNVHRSVESARVWTTRRAGTVLTGNATRLAGVSPNVVRRGSLELRSDGVSPELD